MQFLGGELSGRLRASAARLGSYLGARGEDIVFVDNATSGLYAVLDSHPWRPGDGLALLARAYPGVMHCARRVAERHDLGLKCLDLEPPFLGPEDILERLAAQLDDRTRMLLVDHISSQFALVYPVAEIIRLCRQRGIAVIVDGAHAPGMLPLNLDALAADAYVGNAHKWLYAPKGCAFIWSNPATGPRPRPNIASVFWEQGYHAEFDWPGTRDPTPWLAVDTALEFMRDLDETAARRYMFDLAEAGAELLRNTLDTPRLAPRTLQCAMASVPLPVRFGRDEAEARHLHDSLWNEARIEVPIQALDGRLYLRLSAQVYNELDDYAALAEALTRL